MGIKSERKRLRALTRKHAQMAKLLLPPTPKNCPPYTVRYFESYGSKLFSACRNARHKHCPRTSSTNAIRDGRKENFYCKCPCHLPKMSRYQRRKLWLDMKKELAKSERKTRVVRDPNAVRTPVAVGTRGQKKTFRYVKAPADKIPAGIMHIVHAAIAEQKEGTVAEIAAIAIANGLEKVTGQDPTTQTSVMLHRMLKAGVVEVL